MFLQQVPEVEPPSFDPALQAALDGTSMRRRLAQMLNHAGGWRIEECRPGKVLVLPGERCTLRYELQLGCGSARGVRRVTLGARLAGSASAAAGLVADELLPLASTCALREELAPFAFPVADLPSLGIAAYGFPIDPDLPTLIAATDPSAIGVYLRDATGVRVGPGRCRISVARYGRRARCVLRYELPESAAGPARVMYGKVYGSTALPETGVLVELDGMAGSGTRVPRLLGTRLDLNLLVLDAIPGRPRLVRMLRFGRTPQLGDALTSALDACARAVHDLHLHEPPATARALEDVAASLRDQVERMPHHGLQAALSEWIAQAVALAASAEPLPARLAHGDFTPAQVLFDADTCGIIDLDDACASEPAYDLGRFCAYLRLACRKVGFGAPDVRATADAACDRFLSRYAGLACVTAHGRVALMRRTSAHERLALCGLVIHSWQQLKPKRLADAVSILEEVTR
jgi:phosphotransferase family enzyme